MVFFERGTHTGFQHLAVLRRHHLQTAIAKRRSARVRQSRTGGVGVRFNSETGKGRQGLPWVVVVVGVWVGRVTCLTRKSRRLAVHGASAGPRSPATVRHQNSAFAFVPCKHSPSPRPRPSSVILNGDLHHHHRPRFFISALPYPRALRS